MCIRDSTYKIQDDAWALDFYYAHKDDTDAQLVHAVLTNTCLLYTSRCV